MTFDKTYVYEEKRSVFYFYRLKTDDREAFHQALKKLQEENPKAAHILYVCRIQDDKGIFEGASENGEPVKAAHKELFILQKQDKKDVALFAVRYYGGKKLGANNLEGVFMDGFKAVLD